ncbi:GerAB/ArcD/ProY family transporter [Peribacillus psychrosaccharolyticus]|uniref:GerAB/ArcD/ProY family transporter n=1 Tax=Peribacillus psychrosaccharolyticus TaxID=1407 RepID=A0A974NPN7_PERPY|nr:GerAB/ArcD/ProY family transporter [Peribacillus psychrosaccharolyticus]MEC2053780.1 GerAB/ArcD/ProY family transporter [Peribacillus psychrosaccharolyticus]MED3742606.1 GerAB/ArcD/ProY family transporter [Peribacillus psychrosaccharolyticus]QQT01552.1 GerAB/ArcD/ProY family transporter [Peribacillus psychrosaccharolyticus]
MDKSLQVICMGAMSHLGLMFFIYPERIITSTHQGHWEPILIQSLIFIFFLWLYLKGLSYFPQQDIISILKGIGKTLSFILLFPVLLYFIVTTIELINAYAELTTIIFLANTPTWAIFTLIILISTYIAVKGIETILRTSILIFSIFFPLILLMILLSFQDIDWHNAFPIIDTDFTFFRQPSFYTSFFSFAIVFSFLGFLPADILYNSNKIMWAVFLLIPFFFLSVYLPLLTFGNETARTLLFPFIITLDKVQVEWLVFDRATMFFALSLFTFIMLLTSLLLWQASQITSQYIPGLKTKYHIVGLSVSIFIICLFIHSWLDVEKLFLWNTPLRFYILIVLPSVIFLIGVRRKQKHHETY